MPITFNCPCGKTLRVNDGLGGKQAQCPACQALVAIPGTPPGGEFEVVEDQAPPTPMLARPVLAKAAAKPPAPPPPEREADDEGDVDKPFRMKKADGRRSDEDYDEERKKARRRNRRGRDDDDYEDEDEFDRAARRRVMGGGRRHDEQLGGAVRIAFLIGGLFLVLLGGVWAYFNFMTPNIRHSFGFLGLAVACSGLGLIWRAITGKLPVQ
jgi:hypothetical protein